LASDSSRRQRGFVSAFSFTHRTPRARANGVASAVSGDRARRGRRFVQRVHRLRTLGLGLGALCVASVLVLHDDPPWLWVLLFAHGLGWPQLAKWIAWRSEDPRRAELRNLMIDSACGGAWIAVMQLNLLPSVLLLTMLCVDKVSVGGARLAARSFVLLVLTALVCWMALGFPVQLATPMSVTIACVPFLVAYPIAISAVTYALSTRVASHNRHLVEIGRTDELTQLPNRQHGFAVAHAALERFRRYGGRCVLIVLDIDHFKGINDSYGHPVGDEVLCALARVLRESCRSGDTPARYGGDEFIIVMPDTDVRGAERFGQRVRERLRLLAIDGAPGLAFSVSMGAAHANGDTPDVDGWIQRADAALYRAKAAGRDRLVAATADIVALPRSDTVDAAG
jgi:diguanylate cyclase